MTANATRGEVSLTLDGAEFVLRPSYEAISAFEADTGCGLLALTQQAEEATMTLDTIAAIVTRCIQAQGRAISDQMMQGVKAPKIAALIMESETGLLGVLMRLRLMLVMAATGGYTATGEPKAAGANGKTLAAN